MDKLATQILFGKTKNKVDKFADDTAKDLKNMAKSAGKMFTSLGGRSKKDVYGYLESLGLPGGIIPKGVMNFNFDEGTCKLTIELPGECEVTYADNSVVYYSEKITARVAVEGLDEIEGIKTKLLFWLPMHSITIDGKRENVYWYVGATRGTALPKTRPRAAFKEPQDAEYSSPE